MIRPYTFILLGISGTFLASLSAQETSSEFATRVEQAIERAIPLLESTSAETAQQRTCFTCHGQAMPVVAFVDVAEHGFKIDSKNLRLQLDHTYAHLKKSRKQYQDGRGTGGQVDTAGWALWALEAGEHETDDVTDAVVSYLLSKQKDTGVWKRSSNRPPSEASDFATTYLALRGLQWFGNDAQQDAIEAVKQKASQWFQQAKPKDTEDRVFQLLSLPYIDAEDRADDLIEILQKEQRQDGGWTQLPDGDSDAYATATVLYALAQAGVDAVDAGYRRGLDYLLDQQLPDGSWHVTTRSKPIQKYFESGFPHGKDQFISTTASCWATVALLHALPQRESPHEGPSDKPESDPIKND